MQAEKAIALPTGHGGSGRRPIARDFIRLVVNMIINSVSD